MITIYFKVSLAIPTSYEKRHINTGVKNDTRTHEKKLWKIYTGTENLSGQAQYRMTIEVSIEVS